MKKITKAIIPAAGLGTRFLPETKAMPKEMLPVVDTPVIQLIVKEAKMSGIKDILIVIGKGKYSIENHFDSNVKLQLNLKRKHKMKMLKSVEESNDTNIYFIRQHYPKGLGDAIYAGRSFIGNNPFLVLLGDDLAVDKVPLSRQLMDCYEKTGSSTLAVMPVPHQDTAKYGVINPTKRVDKKLYDVSSFVEKPDPKEAPSNLAIIGRYVLTPQIFDVLKHTKPGKGGEIQLTDAINTLNQSQHVYAHEFTGDRFDTGNKLSWLKTNIQFGLRRPDMSAQLKQYLKDLAKKL